MVRVRDSEADNLVEMNIGLSFVNEGNTQNNLWTEVSDPEHHLPQEWPWILIF